MKLYYWRHWETNFGDELNPWIWEQLIPEVFDSDRETILVGIGTILNLELPPARRYVVLGSGVGYGRPQFSPEADIAYYCVRGPLSAHLLGLPQDLAVVDPGVLVGRLFKRTSPGASLGPCFMPHWRTAGPIARDISERAGLLYVDPSSPVAEVLQSLSASSLVVTEAMHGAIAADAFGVPWIPVVNHLNQDTLPEKWIDWCLSAGVDYRPHHLGPAFHPQSQTGTSGIETEAACLAEILRSPPVLADRTRMSDLTDRLMACVTQFREDFHAGRFTD